METFLIFLAIAAIQMIAAYSKQKKAAAKKAAGPLPPEVIVIPGYEELSEPELPELSELDEEFEPEPEPVGATPCGCPVLEPKPEPIPDSVRALPATPPPAAATQKKPKIQFNTSNPVQGIIWNAILKEPRYKVKWKARTHQQMQSFTTTPLL